MMDIDKDEITEELKHHKEMLRVLRRRLRERELQEAKHGLNIPGDITSDLHDLTERIQRHEGEIEKLQTEAAVDKEPLAEVEYRALLAKAWATPAGRPTVVGATQLEFDRLRLGVTAERAHEIEVSVRMDLAEEAIYSLDTVLLRSVYVKNVHSGSVSARRQLLLTISRAVRLDIMVSQIHFLAIIFGDELYTLQFVVDLIEINKLHDLSRDYNTFRQFLSGMIGVIDLDNRSITVPSIIWDILVEAIGSEKVAEMQAERERQRRSQAEQSTFASVEI